MRRIGLVAAGLGWATVVVAANPNNEDALTKRLAGMRPGATVDCIAPRDLNNAEVIAGTALLYRDGPTLYLNRPRSRADALRWHDILLTEVRGDQLCRNETVTLLDPVTRMTRGFVVLGSFQRYDPVR